MLDEEIIQLFEERREEAIEQVTKQYGHYCTKIAMNILHNEQDAKECMNDTWMKVWNLIPPKKPNPLKTFLGMVSRSIALTRFQYQHATKRNATFDILLSELEECIPGGNTVEEEYEKGQILPLLNQFLESLPREKRIIFLRRYWYCYSIDEIANEMQVSQSKVKMSLLRTRTELKQYLNQEGIAL